MLVLAVTEEVGCKGFLFLLFEEGRLAAFRGVACFRITFRNLALLCCTVVPLAVIPSFCNGLSPSGLPVLDNPFKRFLKEDFRG